MSINSLNSLGQTLAAAATKATTAGNSASASIASGPAIDKDDATRVSGPGQLLAKLKQLQQSDPTKFKQVMSTLSDTLTEDAKSITDPHGQKMLTEMAAKFKAASDSGDLSGLTPPQRGAEASGAVGGPPPGGGAHHGGHAGKAQSGSGSGAGIDTDPADTDGDGTVSASEALAYATTQASDDSNQSTSAASYQKIAAQGREKMEGTMNRLLSIVDGA